MTNRLELNWKVDGFVDEQRYYCSETPIDSENLPTPKAVLVGDIRTYVDTDIEFGKTYYARVGSVRNGVEKISEELRVLAGSDVYIEFVDLIVRQLDSANDVSRDFKDYSKNNLSIAKIGSPVVINPLHGFSYIIMQRYGKFSTEIPALGISDFTLELDFANLSGGVENGRIISISNSGNSGSLLINKSTGENASVNVMINNGSWLSIINSSKAIDGNFKRIIFQRKDGIFYLFFDGDLVGQSSSYVNFSITNTTFFYNGWPTTSDYGHGVFGECRLTNGVSRYPTQSFDFNQTAISEEVDSHIENVVFIAKPTANSLIDLSQNSRTFTASGNPGFTGDQLQDEPFLVFHGEADAIQVDIPNLETNDFTLEFNYRYFGSTQPYPRIGQFSISDQAAGSCALSVSSSEIIANFWINGGYHPFFVATGLTTSRSAHICLMRKNGVFYSFVDGVFAHQTTDVIFTGFSFSPTLILGTGMNANTKSSCAMHGVRLTRCARYSITGFERPTEAFYTQ